MRLALIGDLGFFGRFCLTQNPELKEYFQDAVEVLSKHDLVIGNLETPFVLDGMQSYGMKSAHISSERQNVKILNHLGIDAVTLANNHVYDYGLESYELTKRTLTENNIQWFGIEGQDFEYKDESNFIVFSGYCAYNTSPSCIYSEKRGYGVNPLDFDELVRKLNRNKKEKKFTVFSVHSGIEHTNYPDSTDVKMARTLAEMGGYIYYGHHPHVLQGIEKVKESLIAYSLGNFCFDDVYNSKSSQPLVKQGDNQKSSVILSIEIKNNKIIGYEAIPFYLGENKMEFGSRVVLSQLAEYTESLGDSQDSFQLKRRNQLEQYYGARKQKRNFYWYIKRLDFRSLILIKDMVWNSYMQKKCVNNKLDL